METLLLSFQEGLSGLLEWGESYTRDQQCANQLAVVVSIVKIKEESRFWHVCKIGVRDMQLTAIRQENGKWSKRSFTEQGANLFKHAGNLISAVQRARQLS